MNAARRRLVAGHLLACEPVVGPVRDAVRFDLAERWGSPHGGLRCRGCGRLLAARNAIATDGVVHTDAFGETLPKSFVVNPLCTDCVDVGAQDIAEARAHERLKAGRRARGRGLLSSSERGSVPQ